MRKLIQTTLLALILSLVLLPTMAGAVEEGSRALDATDPTITGGASAETAVAYHLAEDVTINSTITVTGYVTLDLNNHVLTMTGNGSVFQVGTAEDSGSLTLIDSSSGTTHHFEKNGTTGRWALKFCTEESCGHLTITGGGITGGNADNGGGVFVANGSFAMTGGTIFDCTAKSGGGVYVSTPISNSTSSFTLSGSVTISNCTAANTVSDAAGGGVYAASGATLTMNEDSTLTVTGCKADGGTGQNACGGGVYAASGATLTIKTINISDCEANGKAFRTGGGGLYLGCNYNLTLNGNSSITNCKTSGSGGGVYLAGGSLTMSGGTIDGGNAEGSPAITNAANGGGVYLAGGSLTMTGGTIENCSVTDSGGGVYVDTGRLFEMSGGTISNCKATGSSSNGGGVYLSNSAKLTMNSGGKIENCKVTGSSSTGGGVFVKNSATLTMNSGSTISGCEATGNGGGVYVDVTGSSIGIFEMNGGTISGCKATGSSSNGGGVYAVGTFTMTGGTISDCKATSTRSNSTAAGGGVYVISGATFTMTGGTISGCEATGTGSDGLGGGVYAVGTFTMTGGTISGCKATSSNRYGNGGGVYVADGATLTMNSGSTISGCSASGSNGSGNAGGGGVYIHGTTADNHGTFTMNGGTIKNCSVTNNGSSGGGVYVMAYATFTMQNDATISGCTVSGIGGIGGGIFTNGTVTMTNSAIYGVDPDTALVSPVINASSGGGVYVSTDSTFTMTGATISRCTAASDGGGIMVNDGRLIMNSGSTISDCTASADNSGGGGIYINGNCDGFTMSGATISGCKATGNNSNGGGIYFDGNYTSETCELSDNAQIINCSATNGGGIYVADGKTFTMTDATISGCSATDGGGVYVNSSVSAGTASNGSFTMTNATISGCSATQSGGGVYNRGSFTMTNSTIYGVDPGTDPASPVSNAQAGGGVYANGTTTINNSTISGCSATGTDTSGLGGGLFITTGVSVTMTGSTISGCTATQYGGGAYVGSGTLNMSGGGITGCSATYGGGAYVKVKGTLKVDGASTTINGNTNSNVFLVKNTTTGAFATIAEKNDSKVTTSEVYVTLDDTDDAANLRFIGSLTLESDAILDNSIYAWDIPVLKFSQNVLAGKITIDSAAGNNPIIQTNGKHVFVNQLISSVSEPVRVGEINEENPSHLTALKGITAAGLTVKSGATVTAQGDAGVDSWGVCLTGDDAELLIESGGTLTANGGEARTGSQNTNSAGVYMTGANAKVTVNGTLTASGRQAEAYYVGCYGTSAGIYLTGANSSVTLKGGTLTATGGQVDDDGMSYGVHAASLTLDKSDTAAGTFSASSTHANGIAVYLTAAEPTLHADATITTPAGGVVGSVTGSLNYYTIKASADAPAGAQTVGIAISGPAGSPAPTPDPRPTGGGSATYPVTVPASFENGAVTVSPARASAGSTITITVTPDSGYTLETLTVLDKNGKELTLTNLGGGKYTFKMPSGKVELTASFMEDNSMLNFFIDVPASQYYYEAVKWAVANGITTGIGDNRFGPDLTCTRAQIVTFLYRCAIAMGVDVTVGEDTNILSYTDALTVPEFAVKAFQWAVGTGIIQGYDGSLMPNDDCTRGQIVTMLHRFASVIGSDTSDGESTNILNYTDALTVPEFAFVPFQWAVGAGIIQGYDGNLMPNDSCTRGQIVTMLYRANG